MGHFDPVFDDTLAKEGRYSNNPNDPGGATMWGITQRVAREAGYMGLMELLSLACARLIAKERYWDIWRGEDVAALSVPIAREIFDTLYNGGNSPMWLQEWLNVFNRRGQLYPDLKADGRIGPATLNALRLYLSTRAPRAERVMVKALNCTQGDRFRRITEANDKLEDFTFGWIDKRVGEQQ